MVRPPQWQRESIFDRHTLQSIIQRMVGHSFVLGPRTYGHSLTIRCQGFATSSVVGLNDARGPYAVIWCIAFIIVFTLNRMLRRGTFAHVSEEVFERAPPLTHFNAPTTIIGIGRIGRVRASSAHVPPNAKLCCLGGPVSCVRQGCDFAPQTTTRSNCATSQVPSGDSLLCATLALTQPQGTLWLNTNKTKYAQPPELLARQVFEVMNRWVGLKVGVRIFAGHINLLRIGLIRLAQAFTRLFEPSAFYHTNHGGAHVYLP